VSTETKDGRATKEDLLEEVSSLKAELDAARRRSAELQRSNAALTMELAECAPKLRRLVDELEAGLAERNDRLRLCEEMLRERGQSPSAGED
jgi:predicted nuclease with TOPRIM domain